MPVSSVWILEEQNITISGGAVLDGVTQGNGSHLIGRTLTLNSPSWVETFIFDDDANFADNDTGQTLSGAQVIGGVTYVNGTVVEAEYTLTLTDPATGQTYQVIGYNLVNSSPGYGTIEGLAFIGPQSAWPPVGTPLTVTGASEGPPQTGAGVTSYGSYVTPACFTPGTLIATEGGLRRVEDLGRGDRVMTLHHGPQPLLFLARTDVSAARLRREPALAPVRLPKDAFGPGRPARDMVLSPQHRLLLQGAACELHFGEPALLVAAKDLKSARRVPLEDLHMGVTYLHLAFADHQVIYAEGVETESLLVGPEQLALAPPDVRAELQALYPALAGGGAGPRGQISAVRGLTSREARALRA